MTASVWNLQSTVAEEMPIGDVRRIFRLIKQFVLDNIESDEEEDSDEDGDDDGEENGKEDGEGNGEEGGEDSGEEGGEENNEQANEEGDEVDSEYEDYEALIEARARLTAILDEFSCHGLFYDVRLDRCTDNEGKIEENCRSQIRSTCEHLLRGIFAPEPPQAPEFRRTVLYRNLLRNLADFVNWVMQDLVSWEIGGETPPRVDVPAYFYAGHYSLKNVSDYMEHIEKLFFRVLPLESRPLLR